MSGNDGLITFLIVVIAKVCANEGGVGLSSVVPCCEYTKLGVYMEVCHVVPNVDRNGRIASIK